ncbi:MAG: hypothetical protein JNM96_04675 [Bacteroidia bacterium]|nr:hypothetical protein [Bacteroidia bacterium]
MKKIIITIGVLFLSNLLISQDLKSGTFNWLVGNWESKTNEGKVYESWKLLADNKLEGVGGEVFKKDTVFKENITLTTMGKYWVYVPIVGNQNPILFTLVKSENNLFVFENKEHDFPNKIVYEYIDEKTIKTTVEGNMKGKVISESNLMSKVK